jgi:hypothetical protein
LLHDSNKSRREQFRWAVTQIVLGRGGSSSRPLQFGGHFIRVLMGDPEREAYRLANFLHEF